MVFADRQTLNSFLDVVYCGSLNTQHYPLVKHLLENKIPVLCEKPLTMYLKHTEELVEIARRNKVFLMEASIRPKILASCMG